MQPNLQGGWEIDESMKEAVLRETVEEAGVGGIVGVSTITLVLVTAKYALSYCTLCFDNNTGVCVYSLESPTTFYVSLSKMSSVVLDVILQYKLGTWSFKSKSQGTFHEGHMFPLRVTDEFDVWPEKNVRQRIWVCFKQITRYNKTTIVILIIIVVLNIFFLIIHVVDVN